MKKKRIQLRNKRLEAFQKIENTIAAENKLWDDYDKNKDHNLELPKDTVKIYKMGMTLDEILPKESK